MEQKNKKIDDLEHQLIQKDIQEVTFKMHEGFSSIHTTITKGFELMDAENKRQNDISNIQRTEILRRQDLTNGRVKDLEKVTSIVKFMRENTKMSALIFYAVYNILQVATPANIIKAYQWIKLII